jgi:hypothetical protein
LTNSREAVNLTHPKKGLPTMKRLLTAAAAMLVACSASAQIMECIDAKGAKTLAQFCPPGTVKENMRSSGGTSGGGSAPSATPGAPGASGKSLSEQEAAFKKRALERQEAEAKSEKERADAKAFEKNCNDARAQLKQLQDGKRVSRVDPNTGERSFLDDKDRPGEIASAQKSVEGWCKK